MLTCILNHVATAAHDMPQPAAFDPIGVLDVLSNTTPRPREARPPSRKRRISRHLEGLATRRGEECRLE